METINTTSITCRWNYLNLEIVGYSALLRKIIEQIRLVHCPKDGDNIKLSTLNLPEHGVSSGGLMG